MCVDPVSAMAIAGVVTAVAGKGVSTVSAMRQSTYQARLADRNAVFEREAVADALERGRQDDVRYQQQVSKQMGAQRAALAANGVDLSFGSAADFLADTARIGQQDSATIRENSVREARGMEINAANFGAEASAARTRRTGQAIAGVFDMASTALGGAQQFRRVRASRAGG